MQSGNQDRPDIFDLEIKKPDLLYETVVEVDQRVRMVVLEVLDVEVLRPRLQTILDQGIRSLAVVFMYAYASEHESASAHPGPVCYRKKRAPCPPGDRFRILTPGGGGFGKKQA